jgi:threonine dehydrogenase-like Zn-dependent dehydrogenase
MLVDMVESGMLTEQIHTQQETTDVCNDAYKAFDQRQPGWVKVELIPGT